MPQRIETQSIPFRVQFCLIERFTSMVAYELVVSHNALSQHKIIDRGLKLYHAPLLLEYIVGLTDSTCTWRFLNIISSNKRTNIVLIRVTV